MMNIPKLHINVPLLVLGTFISLIVGFWYFLTIQKDKIREPTVVTEQKNQTQSPVHSAEKFSLLSTIYVLIFFALVYLYYMVWRDFLNRPLIFILSVFCITMCGTHLHFQNMNTTLQSFWDKIDIIYFLIGMNIITVVLDQAGLFDYLAKKIASPTKNHPWIILAGFCLLTYFISLFFNNLTTMMILIPIILSLCRYMDFDSRSFIIGTVVASNLGGASNLVGDFTKGLIGSKTGIPLTKFFKYMIPICIVQIFILILYFKLKQKDIFSRTIGKISFGKNIEKESV